MKTDEEGTGAGIRVLSPDAEEARTVARAIASSTAGGILRSFQNQERTASEIAAALNLPIPTIMYHIDALLEAGLIEVSRITYSVKGREVKKYRQSGQVFIVAPHQTDIRETLLKYASLFGLTIFSAGLSFILLQRFPVQVPGAQIADGITGEMKDTGVMAAVLKNEAGIGFDKESVAREAAQNTAFSPVTDEFRSSLSSVPADSNSLPDLPSLNLFSLPDLVTGILIGGCLVIVALVCLELIVGIRKKRAR